MKNIPSNTATTEKCDIEDNSINDLSKEELLNKLGIRPPSEDEISALIKSAFENHGELEDNLKSDVYNKLDFFLSSQDGVYYYDIKIMGKQVEYNKIMVDYIIKIKCKKFLGMINKISLNHIKKGINNIVNNNVPSEYYIYTSNQQSSAKNSEYIVIQSCIYVHKYM